MKLRRTSIGRAPMLLFAAWMLQSSPSRQRLSARTPFRIFGPGPFKRMSAHYDRAIQVLMKHRNWLTFPVQHYQWHGALALILHEQGQTLEAANEARQALEAAKMTDSGFQYHPNLGLVGDTADEFGNRLGEIAGKPRSGLQWWWKR